MNEPGSFPKLPFWMRVTGFNFGGGKPVYLSLGLPNPVPYRGVFVATAQGAPYLKVTSKTTGPTITTGVIDHYAWGGAPVYVTTQLTTIQYSTYDSSGKAVKSYTGTCFLSSQGAMIYTSWPYQYTGPSGDGTNASVYMEVPGPPGGLRGIPTGMFWAAFTGDVNSTNGGRTGEWDSLGYEAILAADIAAGRASSTIVMASDGMALANESQVVPGLHYPESTYFPTYFLWDGNGELGIGLSNSITSRQSNLQHYLLFTVPDDCIAPLTDAPPTPSDNVSIRYNQYNPPTNDYTKAGVGGLTLSGFMGWSDANATVPVTEILQRVTFSNNSADNYKETYVEGSLTISAESSGPEKGYAILVFKNFPISMLDSAGPYTNYGQWLYPINDRKYHVIVDGTWYGYPGKDSSLTTKSVYSTGEYAVIDTLSAVAVTWAATWEAGQKALLLRRRKWFKKNSDEILAGLKTKDIPFQWANMLKDFPRKSQNTYRPVPISVKCIDELVSDTTHNLDGATEGEWVAQRTATLSYVLPSKTRGEISSLVDIVDRSITLVTHVTNDPDLFDVTLSQTIVGTLTRRQVVHTLTDTLGGSTTKTTRLLNTYVNWHVDYQHVDPGSAVGEAPLQISYDMLVLHPIVRDSSLNYAEIQTMVVQDGTYQEGLLPNSLYGDISAAVKSGAYSETVGYVPPILPMNVQITESIPEIVKQYRKDVQILYAVTQEEHAKYLSSDTWPGNSTVGTGGDLYREWSDACMKPGEIVGILLYGIVQYGEPLGMFSDPGPILSSGLYIDPLAKTEIYGTATYQYDYDSGKFKFMGWVDAAPHYQVVAASVKRPGTGGDPGTHIVSGTTGEGTALFAAEVYIDGGGIVAVNSIYIMGDYTTVPTDSTDEPVVGAGLVGASLGVTLVLRASSGFDANGWYTGGKVINMAPPNNLGTIANRPNALVRFIGVWQDVADAAQNVTYDPVAIYNAAYHEIVSWAQSSAAAAIQYYQSIGDASNVAFYQALQDPTFLAAFADGAAQIAIANAAENTLTDFEKSLIPYMKISFPSVCFETVSAITAQDAQVMH